MRAGNFKYQKYLLKNDLVEVQSVYDALTSN